MLTVFKREKREMAKTVFTGDRIAVRSPSYYKAQVKEVSDLHPLRSQIRKKKDLKLFSLTNMGRRKRTAHI